MKSQSFSDSSRLQKVRNFNKQAQAQNSGSNTARSRSPNQTKRILEHQESLQTAPAEGPSQAEFYKIKCNLIAEQLSTAEDQNQKLVKQNEHLRTLNFEYVKQLNEISASKIRAAEKIIITPEFFESENIQQRVKDFLRKLANNYKLLEKEQDKLVDHCKVMEVDIENYRIKVAEAEEITEKLRKTDAKVDELTEQYKQSGFEIALQKEKINSLESHIDDLNSDLRQVREEKDELIQKYNRTLSQNEEKKNLDHKIIYSLQCKCDHLEHELRLMQGSLFLSNKEISNLDIKLKEMYDQNESLCRMSSSIFSSASRKNLQGSIPNVTFK